VIALAQHNLVPILIAVLVAIVVAFWVFRGKGARRAAESDARPHAAVDKPAAMAPPPVRTDRAEGNSVPDEFSAAARDVAGEFLGVDAHPTMPAAGGPPDNLQTMKGVGPKLAAQLNACGITRFDQLAGLSGNEVAMVDERMGPFKGRIERDRLVEQAAYLARGDTDGFEATFGRLGGA
jgi:predicted flap endonuclease-1-like 5' DNA nuclease